MFRREQLANLIARKLFRSAKMKSSNRTFRREFPRRFRDDWSRSRAAKLIGEEIESLSLSPRILHFFVESAIPLWRCSARQRKPDNAMPRVLPHDFLRGYLCFGIRRERIHTIGFDVITFCPVENQVRRKENERDMGRKFNEVSRCLHIHTLREIRCTLRIGAAADRGAVDDQLRLFALKKRLNARKSCIIRHEETKNVEATDRVEEPAAAFLQTVIDFLNYGER